MIKNASVSQIPLPKKSALNLLLLTIYAGLVMLNHHKCMLLIKNPQLSLKEKINKS